MGHQARYGARDVGHPVSSKDKIKGGGQECPPHTGKFLVAALFTRSAALQSDRGARRAAREPSR